MKGSMISGKIQFRLKKKKSTVTIDIDTYKADVATRTIDINFEIQLNPAIAHFKGLDKIVR